MSEQRTIVVVGGGFAGTTLARELEGRLPAGYRLLLLSEESYTTFNPLLAEAVVASIFPAQVVAPIREMLNHGRFIMGRVTAIDTAAKSLICTTLAGNRRIEYEHLVIAIGNRARPDLIPGLAAHALPLKTVGDAMHIRNVVRKLTGLMVIPTDLGAWTSYANVRGAGIIARGGFKGRGDVADSAFATQLETHRRYLLRIATLQLRDPTLAEDVVQDTLVAALLGEKSFSGKSSQRTWLTGILKHKIVDAIRQKTRTPTLPSFDDECRVDDLDALFDETGHWENPPADWGNPESQLSEQQFFEVMESCLEKLPANTARIFVMREVMELETDEICLQLTITSNNLWVILHRARLALRECLERNWFATAGTSSGPRGV